METEHGIATVELQPVGPMPGRLAEDLARSVSRSVGVPCRLLPHDPRLQLPWLPSRRQADADSLLRLLEARARPDGSVSVGVTTEDIGNPIFTFFFGRARAGGRAALVSLARLSPAFYGLPDDAALTLRRATREVLHELGHVAGLYHCDDSDCLMYFAGDVEAIDERGGRFCDACRPGLPPGFIPARF